MQGEKIPLFTSIFQSNIIFPMKSFIGYCLLHQTELVMSSHPLSCCYQSAIRGQHKVSKNTFLTFFLMLGCVILIKCCVWSSTLLISPMINHILCCHQHQCPPKPTKSSSSNGCKVRTKLWTVHFDWFFSIKTLYSIHSNCDIPNPSAMSTSTHFMLSQLPVGQL